jgi:hypothetical protein
MFPNNFYVQHMPYITPYGSKVVVHGVSFDPCQRVVQMLLNS